MIWFDAELYAVTEVRAIIMVAGVLLSVSKDSMQLKRRWRLLLISPLVVVFGSWLFLISANYYYAKRAAYLLQAILALKVDNSSIAELKRLGSQHGLRYEESEASACANNACLHMVSPNNQWMWWFLKSPALTEVGERVGLRDWFAVGDIEIENGQVVGKIYGLQFYKTHDYPEIEASAWDEHKTQLDLCAYYPLKRHPGYGFWNASNVRSFKALVSDAASAGNRDHAFQFNLSCLTGWHTCDKLSELMPAAWADYEEDMKWSETHTNTLVWQVGAACPY